VTRAVLLAAICLLSACAPAVWQVTAIADADGVEVTSTEPLTRADVVDAAGVPVITRRFPSPVGAARVDAELVPGASYLARLHSAGGLTEIGFTAPQRGPVEVRVEAPSGQALQPLTDGEVVEFPALAGTVPRVTVWITAREPWSGEVAVCGVQQTVELSVRGMEAELKGTAEADCEVVVGDLVAVLRSTPVTLAEARAALTIERVVFPAELGGEPDPGRPEGRITLPSPGWERILRSSAMGVRGRAHERPWAQLAVTIRNTDARPINTVVKLAVEDSGGEVAPAFEPVLRRFQGETREVTSLLRVPAGGTATAMLPVFVHDDRLPRGSSEWVRALEITAVGADEALVRDVAPLYVSRGSSIRAVGFAVVMLSTAGGLLLLLLKLGPWLRESRTSDLVTVALFANLIFCASAASHLLGLGAASILGPFSSLITGLVHDAMKYALLATLVTLLPRPGVVSIAVIVHYLMSGLALAGFHPTDPLIVGSAVLWLEGGLWLTGVTRSGEWRDDPRLLRFARLVAAFGVASVAAGAVALVSAAVLYRLYFAGWYVVLMLAVPGFLYTAIACWLATGFADSLRKIEA